MSIADALNGDRDTAFCSRCGNENHDVYDGILDCGHSLDDGAWLVDADELRPAGAARVAVRAYLEAAGNEPVIAGIIALASHPAGQLPEDLLT